MTNSKTNMLAILSLIFSFFFFPLGFIFGIMALSQIKHSKEEGKGLAIVGIIVSSIPLTIIILIFLWIILTFLFSVMDGFLSSGPEVTRLLAQTH